MKACSNSSKREAWAVALCFASTTIMSLEALHPTPSVFMDMNPDQYFGFSALIASLSAFMGTFVLMRALARLIPPPA
jgi:hypothetical protein